MFTRRVLCGLVLACAASPAVAADDKLQGIWTGSYEYPEGGPPAVKFEMRIAELGGKFVARAAEANTFGENPTANPKLYADCKGKFNANTNKVSWTKTYDGTDGQVHSVEYGGTLSADGKTIEGTWTLNDLSGKFTLKKEAGK
jgi:hypothetical protein